MAAPAVRSRPAGAEENLLAQYLRGEYEDWTDMNQHMSTLRLYASRVRQVTEAGVRYGESTWALLQGLHEADSDPLGEVRKSYCGYDVVKLENIQSAKIIAGRLGIRYKFVQARFEDVDIDETDLLFIDTFHVYPQLRAELRRHARHVRQYIILHDTTLDEYESECTRELDVNCNRLARLHRQSAAELQVGLWPAVEEFMATHPEWLLERRFTHENGLSVLRRVEAPTAWHPNGAPVLNRQIPPTVPNGWPCLVNLTRLNLNSLELWEFVPANIRAERRWLTKQLEMHPSAWAHARLGVLLSVFALQLEPDLPRVNVSMLALKHFKKALRLDPLQPQALLAHAQELCPRWSARDCGGSNQKKAESLLGLAATAHSSWEAHLALGELLSGRGDILNAQKHHQLALQLRPRSRHVLNALHDNLQRSGQHQEAQVHLHEALNKGLWRYSKQRPNTAFWRSPASRVLRHASWSLPWFVRDSDASWNALMAAQRRVQIEATALRHETLIAIAAKRLESRADSDGWRNHGQWEELEIVASAPSQPAGQAVPGACASAAVSLTPLTCGVAQQLVCYRAALLLLTNVTVALLHSSLQGLLRLQCTLVLPNNSNAALEVAGSSFALREGRCRWLDASFEQSLSFKRSSAEPVAILQFDWLMPSWRTGEPELEPAPLSPQYWQQAFCRADAGSSLAGARAAHLADAIRA